MPRKVYSEETKLAILNTAQAARAEGKNWSETYEYAKQAGYTGSPQGITQMLRAAKGKTDAPEMAASTNGSAGSVESSATAVADTELAPAPKTRKTRQAKAPKAAKPAKAAKSSVAKAPKAAAGRQRYDDATRTAIIDEVHKSRTGGATWSEAHAAAQSAGYKGGAQALMLMYRKQSKVARKAAKAAKANTGAKPGRKPGRPSKAQAQARSQSSASNTGNSIEQMIEREIQARVGEKMNLIISALQSLIS